MKVYSSSVPYSPSALCTGYGSVDPPEVELLAADCAKLVNLYAATGSCLWCSFLHLVSNLEPYLSYKSDKEEIELIRMGTAISFQGMSAQASGASGMVYQV